MIVPRLPHPHSKVPGANMGPIWGQQYLGGPHVGPMNFVIWMVTPGNTKESSYEVSLVIHCGGFHPSQSASHPALRLSSFAAIWDPLSGDYWHLSWQMSDPMYDEFPSVDGFVQKRIVEVWCKTAVSPVHKISIYGCFSTKGGVILMYFVLTYRDLKMSWLTE